MAPSSVAFLQNCQSTPYSQILLKVILLSSGEVLSILMLSLCDLSFYRFHKNNQRSQYDGANLKLSLPGQVSPRRFVFGVKSGHSPEDSNGFFHLATFLQTLGLPVKRFLIVWLKNVVFLI